MICLTGDLHHQSLQTGNQKHADDTEIRIAQKAMRLIEKAGVKVTFFISGRAFIEEWKDLRPICNHPLVEVGGHTFDCFEPALLHRVWNKFTGNYNGPYFMQKQDVRRTMRVIRERTGRDILAWRNHMYMHGPNTERILHESGIKLCSDGVNKSLARPLCHRDGIWNLPLNIMPDHEHIYHAERTVEWVEAWRKRYHWSDDFGGDSYFIDEWAAKVIGQIERNEAAGKLSTMIIHPITMELADKMEAFRHILDLLARCECIHIADVLAMAERGDFDREEAEAE